MTEDDKREHLRASGEEEAPPAPRLTVPRCAHDTPVDERCWICEPLKLHLFPSRNPPRVPSGNRPLPGSRQR